MPPLKLLTWCLPGLIAVSSVAVVKFAGLSSESRVSLENWQLLSVFTPVCAAGFLLTWRKSAARWSAGGVAALLMALPTFYLAWYWVSLAGYYVGIF